MPTLHRDFLIQTAAETGLAPKQAEVFLQRFAEDLDYSTIQRNLSISEDACSQLMSQVYKRFSIQGRTRGKESQLLSLLLGKSQESNVKELNPSATSLDWHQISRRMLNAQGQRFLTTNPLTAGDGMRLELDRMYVPTTLVERKQRSRYISNISSERESNVCSLEPYTEAQSYHGDNFERAIKKRETPKSEGQRIALIGFPGIGKTTRLQRIAVWVLENLKQDMVIWVSLSDLQGKTLEQYLLEDWLKNALAVVRVKPEMEELLAEQFRQNRVWLLLDGLDELQPGVTNPVKSLSKQFTGWLASARIVLTCRSNAWDAGENYLENTFDVYSSQGFNSKQIEYFIDKYLNHAGYKQELWVALHESNEKWSAAKNPLYLALICYLQQCSQGNLSKNYLADCKGFANIFYHWKEELSVSDSNSIHHLNQILKKLALRVTMEPNDYVKDSVVFEILNESNIDIDIFNLALCKGWINSIDFSSDVPGEKLYSFSYPILQKYFASQEISNWNFFFEDYRIVDKRWLEVILLWIKREDVSIKDRENFMLQLGLELHDLQIYKLASTVHSTVKTENLLKHIKASMAKTLSSIDDYRHIVDTISSNKNSNNVIPIVEIYEKHYSSSHEEWIANEAEYALQIIAGQPEGQERIAEILSSASNDLYREILTKILEKNKNKYEISKILADKLRKISNLNISNSEAEPNSDFLNDLIELIELDSEGTFVGQYMTDRPEINFKTLFKRRVVNDESWETIAQSLEVDRNKLDGFYKKWTQELLKKTN